MQQQNQEGHIPSDTPEEHTVKRGIYAIYDNKAQDIVSVLQHHAHEAVAVRTFTDVALAERSMMLTHPDDFDLVQLGYLMTPDTETDNFTIIPAYRLIITGKALMEAISQAKQTQETT